MCLRCVHVFFLHRHAYCIVGDMIFAHLHCQLAVSALQPELWFVCMHVFVCSNCLFCLFMFVSFVSLCAKRCRPASIRLSTVSTMQMQRRKTQFDGKFLCFCVSAVCLPAFLSVCVCVCVYRFACVFASLGYVFVRMFVVQTNKQTNHQPTMQTNTPPPGGIIV